ncbi:Integral membrane protein [Levilactobacillus brevis]|nr:Integral membrane protein [Levilactobacillus brevis]
MQAWTHGPLTGHTAVQSKTGRVVMTIPENPANTFVESHLLFPTQVTAANPNTRAQNRRAAAQKQEAKLAADANAKRQQQRWLV